MQNTREEIRNRKIIAFTESGCYPQYEKEQDRQKFSCTMAMILGLLVTLEIMVAGAMILNIDFHTADTLAVIFVFAVVYFGVVAGLTDK